MTKLFDSHFHIIDPNHPLTENNGYLPELFTVDDYITRVEGLNVAGGAVVSGSFQAFDQGYLKDALAALGPGYVGVTQIPAGTSDQEILDLDKSGMKAVRFNLKRGGSAGLDDLETLARRVYDLAGWHTELYVDARELDELESTLISLPAVSIDHLGMHRDGLPALLRLVENGIKVKATGFGRVELDPAEVIKAIMAADPTALMIGTDLPSTRAKRPFEDADLDLIAETVDKDHVDNVFWNNAAAFYLGDQ
ncbi:PUTATIVE DICARBOXYLIC ACID HYDROLASE [Corynebacterium glutamicum]|uniref:amidohydrolase family protein n=1 Tax=Corynebacterium glutamicum TaxID=1718 RepID=UPI00097E9827|nr:amidohydrolase family protein [Corynebacterium glutamicum]SJM53451.1 PUTATIVE DICARBOXYLIC ACID HYDROLASE [Corynebacterium glutamicum]